MIVKGPDGIAHIAQHVRQALVPSVADPYLITDLRFTAMCLDLIAEDYDRAVDVLVADRADIADIFKVALPYLEDGLREQVRQRLDFETKDLRVRTLSQRADGDMAVLIELHRISEGGDEAGDGWAAEINAYIWRFIGNYADRRKYESAI
jgi:hypothetical protein